MLGKSGQMADWMRSNLGAILIAVIILVILALIIGGSISPAITAYWQKVVEALG